jgi:adenylate cyclase
MRVGLGDEGPRILIVDDNGDNRYTLERRLRREGFAAITCVEDGEKALEALEATPFDLVLLDIMMPGLSGYEVLERVKADTEFRDIPVIMISAVDELESVVKCIELGAEDYLSKPFSPVLLRARLRASLDRKRLRDQEAAYLAKIEWERRRSDDLLYAVLPAGVVEELKRNGAVEPRRHEEVAVMFADLVGFTAFCDANPPEIVVEGLNGVISCFEKVVVECGLEKIKTIGDALVATGGLHRRLGDPALAALRCAHAMIDGAAALHPPWRLRVGIALGPVVAGIVGDEPYQFDVWGDTVNVAARLCDHGQAGQVLLDPNVWLAVRRHARGRSLGAIELKGKGAVDVIDCKALR